MEYFSMSWKRSFLGAVLAWAFVLGCGAAPEDAQEIGQTEEALTASSVIPNFYGRHKGGCVSAEDVGCSDGENSYCPNVGTAGDDVCLVPPTRTIRVGINFNVAVGPETGVDFRQVYSDMMTRTEAELAPSGWAISHFIGSAPVHVGFGSLPVGALGDTVCPNNHLAGVTRPGRGDTTFFGSDNNTCTTAFDDHRLALELARRHCTTQAQKNTAVGNTMKHEFGHMIGLDHYGDRGVMEAFSSEDTFWCGSIETYNTNQMLGLRAYHP